MYLGFTASAAPGPLVALFLVYGLSFGLTEGAERALLADLAPGDLRATVFGLHGLGVSVGALLASVACGALWEWRGPGAAFGAGAALALIAAAAIGPMAQRRD